MKKITSFLTAVLLFGGLSTAKADLLPELQGLKKVVVDVDNPVMTSEEIVAGDGWYVLANVRNGEAFVADTLGTAPSVVRIERAGIYPRKSGAAASVMGRALIRLEAGETEGSFKVMFGTGRYIIPTANGQNRTKLEAGTKEEASDMYIYVTETGGTPNPGKIAINYVGENGAYSYRVDTDDWAGESPNRVAPLTIWNSGKMEEGTGNNIFILYRATVDGNYTEKDMAVDKLQITYDDYSGKHGNIAGKASAEHNPGTYDADLVSALEDLLNQASEDYLVYPDEYSIEDFETLNQQIIDAYNAAIASYVNTVPTKIEPGYYYFTTPRRFYEVKEAADPDADPETVFMHKYMLSKLEVAGIQGRWGDQPKGDSAAVALWHVTASDTENLYHVKNAATDAAFTNTLSVMSTESDSLIRFDYVATGKGVDTEKDTTFYNLRLAYEADREGASFHTEGHGRGTGKENIIVKWSPFADANGVFSYWNLVPVTDADAKKMIDAYAPIKADKELQIKAKRILADVQPKLPIALDNSVEIKGDSLIKDTTQLFSPYAELPSNEPGNYYRTLIDGNPNTYWHTMWNGDQASVATGHYLQIELVDPAAVSNVAAVLVRRIPDGNKGTHDNPTAFDVYGTNDKDAAKEACTLLGSTTLAYSGGGQADTTDIIATQGMKYLRYYATDCTAGDFRTYWHTAHFQLYPAVVRVNEHSQAIGMGKIFTDMQTAVNNALADGDVITKEHCEALIAAYDPFIARYVNPDTLRNTIVENTGLAELVVEGDQPGMWSKENVATGATLTAALADAKSYDAAGIYSPADSKAKVNAILNAKKDMFAKANAVKTDKWYKFHFPSTDLYDKYGWDKKGADEFTRIPIESANLKRISNHPALFDKYLTVGTEHIDSSEWNTAHDSIIYNYFQLPVLKQKSDIFNTETAEEVAMGNNLFFVDALDESSESDGALFRFIPASDTTYTIQNKLTGLYLRAAGGQGLVTLSVQPTFWKNEAMGAGKLMSTGIDILGRNNNQLHGQRERNTLCTWGATGVGSNTGFLLEEAGDVDPNYARNDVKMSLMPNAIYAFCYPVDMTPAAGKQVYGVSTKGTEIILNVYKDNKALAGDPFIYITGTGEFDEEASKELHSFTYGNVLNTKADTIAGHVGSYFETTAPRGAVIPEGDSFIALTTATRIGANSAWINALVEDPRNAEVTYKVANGDFDAIKDAVANVNKGGKIYSIDGTYVGKGNINTVKGLKKGLYIVNGVKVMVK